MVGVASSTGCQSYSAFCQIVALTVLGLTAVGLGPFRAAIEFEMNYVIAFVVIVIYQLINYL